MARVSQQIKVYVTGSLKGIVTPTVWGKALDAGARQAEKEIRDRTVAGVSAKGLRFKGNQQETIEQKREDMRHHASQFNGEFAAERATVVGRRSGKTLRDLFITAVGVVSGSKAQGTLTIKFKTPRSSDVAKYLAEQGRPIAGLSPASTARGKQERARIRAAILKVIRANTPIRIIVK